ncbi:MAG: NAD(P)-dependent oxidoreductase [Calditrichaeota bacterium]|nr:MAG: NAD(P)-dependent oxidoreductase [Calditrichota bacterium]
MSTKSQTIAVLGANGFAGRHICQSLLEKGEIVHGYSRSCPEALLQNGNFTYYECDISKANSLEGSLQYDCLINATGRVAGVGYNSHHHREMETGNFLLMMNAADLAYEQAKYFIQISSACVYANEVSEGADESQGFVDLPDPANRGYGIGKRKGEEYTKLLFAGQSRAFTIIRPYNLYGPGDDFSEKSHVIPALINKLLFEENVDVWGDGTQLREFVYVKDLAGCISQIAAEKPNGVFNICGGKENILSIRELVTELENIIQSGKNISFGDTGHTGQIRKYGNNKKMQDLGLRLQTPIDIGLRETVLWRLQTLENQPEFVDAIVDNSPQAQNENQAKGVTSES